MCVLLNLCYKTQDKLAEREEKLKSITAGISARKRAREEPQRKAKLAAPTRVPSRRGQRMAGGTFHKSMDKTAVTSECNRCTSYQQSEYPGPTLSLVSRLPPAFHRLQYEKLGEVWGRGYV